MLEKRTKNSVRAGQAESRARYAPRKIVVQSQSTVSPEMVAMKKLTSKVLDDLKNPSAIPSQVILSALLRAREL